MGLIQHVINLGGWQRSLTRRQVRSKLAPGREVTVVDWRGCMADVRQVQYVGTVNKVADQPRGEKIECLFIKKPDGTLDWQPLERVRFIGVDERVEVWL